MVSVLARCLRRRRSRRSRRSRQLLPRSCPLRLRRRHAAVRCARRLRSHGTRRRRAAARAGVRASRAS
eukprot:9346871-Alexandrium_andersonii.AAC.1